MPKSKLFSAIDARSEDLQAVARELWETPELGLEEEQSSSCLREVLCTRGFDVTAGVGEMPTAFVAEYGTGSPRIGILGEYDALPGLSQTVSTERDPREDGGPGHGCGHNLLGTAGVGATIALKESIASGDIDGTVRFYGCPAEEILVGKVFMARAGVFDDLDAAITWHPADLTRPKRGSSLALDSVKFRFEGVSAHAAAAPDSGHSALDAVQLLNTGVEFMREHISDEGRVHYNITDGGDAPNVVPSSAEARYFTRATTRRQVERLTDWVRDIADGAALMTHTEVHERYITGCYDFLTNQTVATTLEENLELVGEIPYEDDDHAFAAELQETILDEMVKSTLQDVPAERRDDIKGRSLVRSPVGATDRGQVNPSSGDVGDVSYIAPTAQFYAATWPLGTPAHSWQAVVANGDFAIKAIPYVAKVLAGTAYDLIADDSRLEAAREEFVANTHADEYETPLLPESSPPFGQTN